MKTISRTGSLLFIVLLAIQLYFFKFLMDSHRIPIAHDGFHIFTLQYFFMNNAAISGEIPQWIPFMSHGTTATWWYSVQGVCGLWANMMLQWGTLLKNMDFFMIYYAGMFFDELVLLTGTWLLGRRFFSSPFTVFFVSVSVMGSSIWATQPYFNFYHFYTIPLIIHFIHRFLEERKWHYLFFAVNLFTIQVIGNSLYVLPMVSMVIFMYFLIHALYHQKQFSEGIPGLRFDWKFFFYLFLAVFSIAMIYLAIKAGMDRQIVNYDNGRHSDGDVPLNIYLTYAAATGGIEWRDLILRFSPGMDYTLYIGFLALPFIVIGFIYNCSSAYRQILFLILFLLLFSSSSFISVVFYYCWPLMKYYRHLALVAPITKIFLCFLAGFGFDHVCLRRSSTGAGRSFYWVMSVLAVIFGYLAFHLLLWAYQPAFLQKTLILMKKARLLVFVGQFDIYDLLKDRFVQSSLYAYEAAFILLAIGWLKQEKWRPFLIAAVLIFHVFDLYSYKFSEYCNRTMPLTRQQQDLFKFQDIPYSMRRDHASEGILQRESLLGSVYKKSASTYWTFHAFTFFDPEQTSLITYNWQVPFDNMIKAFDGQSMDDLTTPPLGYKHRKLIFPVKNEAARKISGVDEDKVQFFNNAHMFRSESEIAKCISSIHYRGDMIFLSDLKGQSPVPDLSGNERLHLPYKVLEYSADHLKLKVDAGSRQPVWMLYSDVWHPLWRAKVNNEGVKVYKTDLAYKAVSLMQGANLVEFYFKSQKIQWLQGYFGWSSFFWIVTVFAMAVRLSLSI